MKNQKKKRKRRRKEEDPRSALAGLVLAVDVTEGEDALVGDNEAEHPTATVLALLEVLDTVGTGLKIRLADLY